jgi:hypothetical protein
MSMSKLGLYIYIYNDSAHQSFGSTFIKREMLVANILSIFGQFHFINQLLDL